MRITCKKTKHFLCEIDIEQYLKNLEEMGISQEIPLTLTLNCRRCHKTEVYKIYKNHYKFEKNIDKNISSEL